MRSSVFKIAGNPHRYLLKDIVNMITFTACLANDKIHFFNDNCIRVCDIYFYLLPSELFLLFRFNETYKKEEKTDR